MNFTNVAGLTVKVSTSTAGVSSFIKDELRAIPKGQALAMVDLVRAVQANCPTVPNKHQAYTRINNVLSREFGKGFIKLVGDDGYTYISKASDDPTVEIPTISDEDFEMEKHIVEGMNNVEAAIEFDRHIETLGNRPLLG